MNPQIPPADCQAIGYSNRGVKIPDRLGYAIDSYLERGEDLGHFLEAVVRNDLSEAVFRADAESLSAIHTIVVYLYNHAPDSSWGSAEKVEAWRKLFQPSGEMIAAYS